MPLQVVIRGNRVVHEAVPDRLQEVGPGYPAPAVKAAAEAALRDSVADLGLPSSTRIVWCVVESESSRRLRQVYGETPWKTVALNDFGGARGLVHPDEPDVLWVRGDQEPEAVANTVRHECRHSWQLQPGAARWAEPGLQTMDEREADAAAYADRPPAKAIPAPTPRPALSSSARPPAPAAPPAARRAAWEAARAAYADHVAWLKAGAPDGHPLYATKVVR